MNKKLFKIWKLLPPTLKNIPFCLYYRHKISKAQQPQQPTHGKVFLAGFYYAPTGLGESVRCYFNELQQSGINVIAIDLTLAFFQTAIYNLFTYPCIHPEYLTPDHLHGTIIIHVNPPAYLYALHMLSPLLHGKHRVAYWAWELLQLPFYWRMCIPYADRIETPSTFTTAAIRRYTKFVTTHAHVSLQKGPRRRAFAEDGVVRILFMLDLRSSFERKNPLAALRAFTKAFGKSQHAHFLIKVSSMEDCPAAAELLRNATAAMNNVTICDAQLDAHDLSMLYKNYDIYLSLHRSEGYGLTIKEAMNHGLYVVATGWSGNMDFMSGEKTYSVPYSLTTSSWIVNSRFSLWAEANVDYAASILQRIVKDERHDLLADFPPGFQCNQITPEKTSLVVVTYNNVDYTLKCIESIYSMQRVPCRIIVVENGSDLSIAEKVFSEWKGLAKSKNREKPVWCTPGTHSPATAVLLRIEENHGYSCGCNAGIAAALDNDLSSAVWLLNNDTIVAPDALDALCERLNMRSDAGMAASVLVSMVDHVTVQNVGGGTFSRTTGVTHDTGRGSHVDLVKNSPAELFELDIDYACGTSLLVKADTIKDIGFFDESFFLYYEDVDYSFRVKKSGYSFVLANSSVVYHKEGATTSSDSAVIFYATRNRLRCVWRHNPCAIISTIAHVSCGIVKSLLTGQLRSAVLRMKALASFLKKRQTK